MQGCVVERNAAQRRWRKQDRGEKDEAAPGNSLSDELRRTPESRLTQSPSVRARSTTASLNPVAHSKEMQTHLDSNAGSTLPTSQPPHVKKHDMRAKKFQERCAEENKRALLYTPIEAPDAATEPMTSVQEPMTSVQQLSQQMSVQEAIQTTFNAIQQMPTPPAWVKTLSFEIGHMKWTMTIHPPGHLHHGQTGQQPVQSLPQSSADESTAFHSAPINSVDWSTHPPLAGWPIHPDSAAPRSSAPQQRPHAQSDQREQP